MISSKDIEQAFSILKPVVHETPLLSSTTLDRKCGNSVFLKAENFQRIGSFKIRGAYNKIAQLSGVDRQRGVVAHSSGNHAQGVALASKLLGVRATIVMPKTSPSNKVEATREYGAEVVFCEDSSDDRERVALELERKHGYVPVPPYDDDQIIAGQGTVGREIAKSLEQLNYLFVPVGGGGLIAGCAVAVKHFHPKVRVIGVETETANDCYQSFRKREIVRIEPPKTIADGMRTQSVGTRNFEIIMNFVDDVVTVTDDQVIAVMKFFLERMKIIVEPTGAVAPAAVYHNVLGISGQTVCAVLSGGNVNPAFLKTIL
ncbi:MAG: threonine/serine dehydratase [Ignavibacteriales bacterium]|nr:threonine/serine dehydratase [Ignavibacteriales bacterium]